MSEAPFLRVGVGNSCYVSSSSESEWQIIPRSVPWRTEPKFFPGRVSLPLGWKDNGAVLDFVHVGGSGFGIAVGKVPHSSEENRSVIWSTSNGGLAWKKEMLQSRRPAQCPKECWPVGEFSSGVVLENNAVAMAWTDPWLFDHPSSHVVTLGQDFKVASYYSLENMCLGLAKGGGRFLRAFSFGFLLESVDFGATWHRSRFHIDWKELDARYDSELKLIREPQFISSDLGYALVVQSEKRNAGPPITGLAKTRDGGRNWVVLQSWVGPKLGDMNERHVTSLEVVLD